ncbi:hypothetical protein B0O80DRAFT_158416 [Mortierella sp. GBAus27b]|nr:hypothetical protein B0O80DRAFT_158416 [Mortierella sp. GBAus27b]
MNSEYPVALRDWFAIIANGSWSVIFGGLLFHSSTSIVSCSSSGRPMARKRVSIFVFLGPASLISPIARSSHNALACFLADFLVPSRVCFFSPSSFLLALHFDFLVGARCI